jgi:hypothetical protein
MLTRYLAQPARSATPAPHIVVPPINSSFVIASESGVQASNNWSIVRPFVQAIPRVKSSVDTKQRELIGKRLRSSTGTGSFGSGLIHMEISGHGDTEDVSDFEKFTAT